MLACLSPSLMFTGLLNHFPLLTMIEVTECPYDFLECGILATCEVTTWRNARSNSCGRGGERLDTERCMNDGCTVPLHSFYSFSWRGGSLPLAWEPFCSVIFVVNFLSDIFQVLHVGPEKRNERNLASTTVRAIKKWNLQRRWTEGSTYLISMFLSLMKSQCSGFSTAN